MGSQTLPDEWPIRFCVGYHDAKRDEPLTEDQLNQAWDCNYNMLTTFITNSHFRSRINALISEHSAEALVPEIPPLTDLDTHLEPGNMATSVAAFTSPWIDVCSPDPLTAGISKQVLYMEIAFAAFCGFEQIVIQGPRLFHWDPLRKENVTTDNIMQYARAIQDCLNIGMRLQISILLPFDDNSMAEEKPTNLLNTRGDFIQPDLDPQTPSPDSLASWETWNTIRTTCKYHARLTVALQLPPRLSGVHVQSRWFSEPVKALTLAKSSFTLNAKGWPTLQLLTQAFLKPMMRLKAPPWIILTDVGSLPEPDAYGQTQCADGEIPDEAIPFDENGTASKQNQHFQQDNLDYLNYIRYLERTQDSRSEIEREGTGYQDYLQIPLQPLTDNLESMTYEVFEKDPVKYDLYEAAIRKALRDWADQRKPTSGPNGNGKVVVVVAGAGRGPLVTRALKASIAENVPIDMWAVEKNPNAFVLLKRHNRSQWKGQVRLEQSDMRSWKGPWTDDYSPTPAEASRPTADPPEVIPHKEYYGVDILISELLGSFGDNELSPECLDGILHLLAPQGISIPQSYTAWLTPISAPKLHADIYHRTTYDPTAPETPAVVWLHQIDYLSHESINRKTQNGTHTEKSSAATDTQTEENLSIRIPSPEVLCAWEFKHGSASNQSTKESTQSEHLTDASTNTHNFRFSKLTFRTRHRGVCHGLGGYFESVLYPGVEMSTNPNTINDKSKNMMSWFPIFFPLKTPLYVPSASTLDVSMWRQTDGRKVWYEWMVESYGWNIAQPKRSADGEALERRAVRLGMTELHSSIKNACLM